MDENQQVLSGPTPIAGARFDVTHRPERDEVGLLPGSRTIVVGRSTDRPFATTLVTGAGEVVVQTRDVAIDSESTDGPVAQIIVQLVIASRSERDPELRSQAAVLGLDMAEIDAFLAQAAMVLAVGLPDTLSTNLRGGTTGGGTIEVVLRHNPNDDTIFENVQVTWPS